MNHKLIFTIAALDAIILLVTALGFFFTLRKIHNKKYRLIPRDYGLLGMYFTFLLFTLLSFVVEWSMFIRIHDEIANSIYYWIFSKRLVHAIFTGLAITWSSGYKYGGTQPSGI